MFIIYTIKFKLLLLLLFSKKNLKMYKKIELQNQSQKQFETKLKQIEKNLEPLINQITSPSSGQFGSNKSLSAQKLVDILNDSIVNFLTASENILNEETSSYLIAEFQIGEELNKFRLSSNQMIQISKIFSTDPSSSDRRLQMIQKARELLSSVSQLFEFFLLQNNLLFIHR